MATNPFTGANTTSAGGVSAAGKKGGKKKGLYKGKAGAAASNQDPLTFFQTAARRAGTSTGAMTGFDDWYNNFQAPRMVGDYNAALAGNEHLSAKKWLRKTYDVGGWGGPAGNFKPGQLAPGSASLLDKYDIYDANTRPDARVATQAALSGDVAGNGNQQYQDWITQDWNPQMQAEYATQQRANPMLNFRDFMNAQDPERMRRAFANRAPSRREPSANAPQAGRWSWWS